MCEGEINQAAHVFNYHQSEADYFNNIYKKTACLFSTSCQAGALASDLPSEQSELLGQFGLYLGYAYQILDDILDLVANPADLGKPVGSDLTRGILTLPVLRLLQDEHYGPMLKKTLDNREVSPLEIGEIVSYLTRSDGLKYTFNCLTRMLNSAKEALDALPDVPARYAMQEISAQLLAKPLEMAQQSPSLGLQNILVTNPLDSLTDRHKEPITDLFPAEWVSKLMEQYTQPPSTELHGNFA
jgi:heptaprenyl diphosphate synthase